MYVSRCSSGSEAIVSSVFSLEPVGLAVNPVRKQEKQVPRECCLSLGQDITPSYVESLVRKLGS